MISWPSWLVGVEGHRVCLQVWQLILIAILDVTGIACLCAMCARGFSVANARQTMVLAKDYGSKAIQSSGRLASTLVSSAPETLKTSIRHAGLAMTTGAQAMGEMAISAGEKSGRIMSASAQGAAEVVPQVVPAVAGTAAAAAGTAATAAVVAGEAAAEVVQEAPAAAKVAGVVAEEAVGRAGRAVQAGAHEIATPQHAGHTLTGK